LEDLGNVREIAIIKKNLTFLRPPKSKGNLTIKNKQNTTQKMNSKSFKCIRVGYYEELINKINLLENENKNLKNENIEIKNENKEMINLNMKKLKHNFKEEEFNLLKQENNKLKNAIVELNNEIKEWDDKYQDRFNKDTAKYKEIVRLNDLLKRHKENTEYFKALYHDEYQAKRKEMTEVFNLNKRIKVLNNKSGLARINEALYTQNKKIIKDSLEKIKTIENLNKEVDRWQEYSLGLKNEIHDEYRSNLLKREAYYDKMGVNPTKQCSVCFEDKPIKHCLTTTCKCNIACCKNCAIHIINSNDGIFKCPTCRNYENPSVAI
jgi:hypothetical protein